MDHEQAAAPVPLPAVADLRVVELGVWVAAPAAAGHSRRLGRRRHQGGGAGRRPDAQRVRRDRDGRDMPNPAYTLDNRGKRSLVLDLRDEGDRARMEDLLADARRVPHQPEARRARQVRARRRLHRRRATRTSCTAASPATASRAPSATVPSYDLGAFWARSGLSYQLASRRRPLNARGGIGDHITVARGVGRASSPGCSSSGRRARAASSRRRCCAAGAYVLGWDLGLQSSLGKVARRRAARRRRSRR